MKAKTTKLDVNAGAYIHFIFEEQGEIVEFSCHFPRGKKDALNKNGMSQAASQALARFQRMVGKTGMINDVTLDQKALVEKINAK